MLDRAVSRIAIEIQTLMDEEVWHRVDEICHSLITLFTADDSGLMNRALILEHDGAEADDG